MPLFRSIACAVDLSDHSRRALGYALALSAGADGRLRVVHVVEPLLVQAAAARFSAESLIAETRDDLERFVTDLIPAGAAWAPAWTVEVGIGAPAAEIVRLADAAGADLVVAGTQGLGGLRRLFFGSTCHALLRQARSAVLAVPPGAPDAIELTAAGASLDLGAVLAAVDFGPSSIAAARLAAGIARVSGIPLLVAHVVAPVHAAPRWRPSAEVEAESRQAAGRSRLELVAEQLRSGGDEPLAIEALTLAGDPAEQIAATAALKGAGLVAMGLGNETGLLDPRPGSTAYRILCLAQVPVLVMPAPAP